MAVATAVIAVLAEEWDAAACVVCGTGKWRHHPFCRSCSIKLQRANMMRPLQGHAGTASAKLLKSQARADVWAWVYDVARDYLFAVKQGRGRTGAHNGDRG